MYRYLCCGPWLGRQGLYPGLMAAHVLLVSCTYFLSFSTSLIITDNGGRTRPGTR